jgi:hypothetical protein
MSGRLDMHERKVNGQEGWESRQACGIGRIYLRRRQDGRAKGRTSIRDMRDILARQANDSLNVEAGQVRGSQIDVVYLG